MNNKFKVNFHYVSQSRNNSRVAAISEALINSSPIDNAHLRHRLGFVRTRGRKTNTHKPSHIIAHLTCRANHVSRHPLSALSTSVCATLIHARMRTHGLAPILTSAFPAVDDINESDRAKWERNLGGGAT